MADDKGRVPITHPDVDAYGRATPEQLEKVWGPRGWKEVSEDEVAKHETKLAEDAREADRKAARATTRRAEPAKEG
jgi:hypothetical protein